MPAPIVSCGVITDRLTVTPAAACSYETVSPTEPLLWPPSVSSPGPPSTVSSPPLPSIVSLPPSPWMLSLPFSPKIASSSDVGSGWPATVVVALMVSLPPEPLIVTPTTLVSEIVNTSS
jgi:hypothetical protein